MGERNVLKERHGKGWAYLPNGDEYDGQYRRGQRHGHGLYVFKNGARYLGNWRCNKKWGIGKFYYPDGSWYNGEWKRDFKHGHGIYTYPNQDVYEGAWYHGQRHGIGKYTFSMGDCAYNGTWKHGIRIGPATCLFEKHQFHGNWKDNGPMGPGAYTFECQTMVMGYSMSVLDEMKWYSQSISKYDFSKLPPEPMPQPISDSEEDDCNLSVHASDTEIIDFQTMPDYEEIEEEDGIEDNFDEEIIIE